MGRLDDDLLERIEEFCVRCLHVTDSLDRDRVSRRVIDQMIGCSTAVGANCFEAAEAMSRKDFVKSISIGVKELNETRFWLRLVGRQEWISPDRLAGLLGEAEELKRILGAIITRTRARDQMRSSI